MNLDKRRRTYRMEREPRTLCAECKHFEPIPTRFASFRGDGWGWCDVERDWLYGLEGPSDWGGDEECFER